MGNMQILAEVKNLWMKLNVQGAILTSLSLQVFLIFFAPIRKRCSQRWIVMLTWLAYMAADLVADYALGLIAKAQFTGGSSETKTDAYGDLSAFWAPFLLLHLGGPDTITAFALEDNELWRRHLLNLLFQLGAAGYVFYQSLPSNKLIVPTIFMFIGGTTKYIERTRALYIASFSKFRDSLLTSLEPGLEPIIKELRESPRAVPSVNARRYFNERKSLQKFYAFSFFTAFKRLLVDLPLSFTDLNRCRQQLLPMSARYFLLLIEVELNFFYDVLYTKAAVVHSLAGYLFRAISIGSVITAFSLFCVVNKHAFHEYDVKITYTLLLGAVGLEFAALIMLICSDWTSASASPTASPRIWALRQLCRFTVGRSLIPLHRVPGRWSKSIYQFNLIESRLRRWPESIEKLLKFIRLREFLRDLEFTRVEPYGNNLGELIFEKLKHKALTVKHPDCIKEMCAARGKWALDNIKTGDENFQALLPFVHEVDYGESILLWHIATELCYNSDKSTVPHQQYSKVLSDYMVHLMIKQPGMMSTVTGFGDLRFRCTCIEMEKFLIKKFSHESTRKITKESACYSLLNDYTKLADVTGDRIKSVLFDACRLAKELRKFEETKWKIMNEVWVELLGYAAIHCRPYMHAQQLSQGGELLTLVWLMMAHLGLSEQFQVVADPVEA